MKHTGWYAVLVLIAGSSYGVVSTIMKSAYAHGFHVQDLTVAQYGIAMVSMWLIALLWRHGNRISGRQWSLLVLLGAAGGSTSYFYYQALTRVPASLAIVLLFQFTWMVVVMDAIATRKWPAKEKLAGLVLILIGTVLSVGLIGASMPSFAIWAVIAGLLAGLSYAVTLYLSGYVETDSSPGLRSAIVVTFSTVLILIPFHPTHTFLPALFHGLLYWGGFVALFGQIIPMLLMLIAIPHTGGRMAGVLGSIELPVAVLFAYLVLREPVSAESWFGIALILAGILVSESTMFRRRNATA